MHLSLNPRRKILTEITPIERTESNRLFVLSPYLNTTGNNTLLVDDLAIPAMHVSEVQQSSEIKVYRMRWDDVSFTILECLSDCSDFLRWLSNYASGKKTQARTFEFLKAYDDGTPKSALFVLYGCLPKLVMQSDKGIHVILSVNNCMWHPV